MSDTQNCVCGHPEKEHAKMWGNRRVHCCHTDPAPIEDIPDAVRHCSCEFFRPALDWPNETGWWRSSSDDVGYVEARLVPSGILWLEGYGEDGFEEEFKARFGGVQFVKAEPNPFVKAR